MDTPALNILVVDDQQLIREGIASILEIQPGISVVGVAKNGLEAVEKAIALEPHVVLMDIHMPGMSGIEATERLRQVLPDCKVLMLTTFDEESYIIRSLRAGAFGYLLKDIPVVDLANAIRTAHLGITQLAPDVAGKLVGSLLEMSRDEEMPVVDHGLSNRELEVLELVATGATNQEIADQLFVSRGTVKNHVSNILGRLGLQDRTQAAIFVLKNNLV